LKVGVGSMPSFTRQGLVSVPVHRQCFRAPAQLSEVERIRAAGGVLVTAEPMAEFGFRWQVLADPDGNELCVA
jgi:predicted enzyme related to lactoylglutathione lyase